MSKLEWHWGYPAIRTVMLAVTGGLLYFFRRKGWFPMYAKATEDATNGPR